MSYYEHFVESQLTGRSAHPSHAHFYRNDGDGNFKESAAAMGLDRSFGSMGAGFGDVDYDGLIDVYLANGDPIMSRFEPNILYHNRGDHFADITTSAGVSNLGKGHGVAFADYDSDGDLDLYAGIGGHYPGDLSPNSLYQNQGHANHWLAVELRGNAANPSAVGARLRLRSGDLVQSAQISSGDGFGCTNSLAAEFGLGAKTRVDTLEIRWPSGHTEYHTDLAADQFLHFTQGP